MTLQITDADGNVTLAAGPLSIAEYVPPAPLTSFGVTLDTLDGNAGWNAHRALYPNSGCFRAYGPTVVPPWAHSFVAPLVAAGQTVFKSAKQMDDASLAAYVADWDAMPDNAIAYYVPYHEDNRPTKATPPNLDTFLGFAGDLIVARNQHPNRARIKLGPIHSWFPAAIGNNEANPWRSFMAAEWDFVGWDQYNPSSSSVMAPADFVALVKQSMDDYDLPGIIGEWGIQPIKNDAGDAKAAAWVTGVAGEYQEIGITHAMYWCAQQGTNPSYHLDNRPAVLAALQAVLG